MPYGFQPSISSRPRSRTGTLVIIRPGQSMMSSSKSLIVGLTLVLPATHQREHMKRLKPFGMTWCQSTNARSTTCPAGHADCTGAAVWKDLVILRPCWPSSCCRRLHQLCALVMSNICYTFPLCIHIGQLIAAQAPSSAKSSTAYAWITI